MGKDLAAAIFAAPNCTTIFCQDIPSTGVIVRMGKVLDSFSDHMKSYPEPESHVLSHHLEASQQDIVETLKNSGAEILINYLPVGSEKATHFYAECALAAGVGLINCMSSFIASDPAWAERFRQAKLPIIGDDIKSQLGATITHRVLADLFKQRGVKVERTYQLNTGGTQIS